MQLAHVVVVLTIVVAQAVGQQWQTGDNSTIDGCSSSCSVENDGDLSCWKSTLTFFEKSLISQLRHYISVQVDIDQWHRRHGKPDGQDFDEVGTDIAKSFEGELSSEDTLNRGTVDQIASLLTARIKEISDHTLSVVPHFSCPYPCEYRHDMYRNLFIASLVLNVALLVSVVPSLVKAIRMENQHSALMDNQ